MINQKESHSAGRQEWQYKTQTKLKNKITIFQTLIKRIVFCVLSWFDYLLTRFIHDTIIEVAFFVTEQCQKLEASLADESEVRHDR